MTSKTQDNEDISGTSKEVLKETTMDKLKNLWESIRIFVFVVGTGLTIFIAARNSLTWFVY